MPSVERWYVLSSVVRRYISFIVSGTSMNYLFLCHQWYGGISLHTFSGTLVCAIVSGTAVHLFISSVVRWYISLHIISGTVVYLSSCHQWYGGIFLGMPSVERWYLLSSVAQRYIS